MSATPQPGRSKGSSSFRRDLVVVVFATALSLASSIHFNWGESFYGFTRRAEGLQVDELPVGLLVLLAGLTWVAWRSNRQVKYELVARRVAEKRLEEALSMNRLLTQEVLDVQDAERKHLALELHDELGQYLNAIKLDAVCIRDGPAASSHGRTVVEAAQVIVNTADHLYGVVRGMIARLRPVALDELGLVAAIEHSLDEWRMRSPDTRFALESRGNFDDCGEQLSLTVYRIIQESLTNASRHAAAGNVQVAVERISDTGRPHVRVSVSDDGLGADLKQQSAGHGLTGMRERAELAGGTLEVISAPGRGLRLTACVPISAEQTC